MSADALSGNREPRPVSWIITALCFIGAQFVIVPFLIFLALASDGALIEAPGGFGAAAALLVGSVILSRARQGLFASQLTLSGILSGIGIFTFVLFDSHVSHNAVALSLAAICLVVILCIDETWLQHVLGAVTAFALMSILPSTAEDDLRAWFFLPTLNITLLALVWAMWRGVPHIRPAGPLRLRIEALIDGIGVAAALALLVNEGTAFFTIFSWHDAAGSADEPLAGTASLFSLNTASTLSMAGVIAAFAWLVWRQRPWPAQRRQTLALLATVFAGLTVFAPLTHASAALAILLAGALAEDRRKMLVLVGLVLLAKLSGFYYALRWPLVDKAALLAAIGAVLGVTLWLIRRLTTRSAPAITTGTDLNIEPRVGSRLLPAVILLAALAAALGVVHWDVRGKEMIIANGRPIFVALAPRDPRSLMQGDYMALNFAWPRDILDQSARSRQNVGNTQVVARVDTRGVATVMRWASAESAPLTGDDILLPLKWMNDGWTLVTDAFYFPEGQGTPLAKARFGEFRVMPDGRALLVGLADKNLQPLYPGPASTNEAENDVENTAENAAVAVTQAIDAMGTVTGPEPTPAAGQP